MLKRVLLLAGTIIALTSLLLPAAALAQPPRAPVVIPKGQTEIEVGHSGSVELAPIPMDFFDPNSDPFSGPIELCGGNPSGPDTIVQRHDKIGPLFPGGTDTIPVEIVALDLVSCQPITVTVPHTTIDLNWDLKVALDSSVPQSRGDMTVTRGESQGDTFDATLPVEVRLIFSTTVSESTFSEIFLDTGPGEGRDSTAIGGTPNLDDLLNQFSTSSLGLPGGGRTTLTPLPEGNWQIDSFFDITYRIDMDGDWWPYVKPGINASNMELLVESLVFKPLLVSQY